MNEQLLALLKTKFDGVQDAILKRVAEKYSKDVSETANEGEIQGVVDKVTFQNVLESYGDSRAYEASNTAIVNYKKKVSKDKTEKTDQQQDQQITEDVPDWAKSLIQKNQELVSKIEGLEKKERTKSYVEMVQEKLEKDKKIPKSFFRNRPIQVNDESEIDSVVDQITDDYGAFKKEMVEKGFITDDPKRSMGGNSDKQIDQEIEEWAENENE
jgi:hypothetical protein